MTAIPQTVSAAPNDKIECLIDGLKVHSIQMHIKDNHPDWTIERYRNEFPEAPLLSPFAEQLVKKRQEAEAAKAQKPSLTVVTSQPEDGSQPVLQAGLTHSLVPQPGDVEVGQAPMHELFDFGNVPAAMNAKGNPIVVRTFRGHGIDHLPYLMPVDQGYVYNIDLVKKVLVGIALNKPTLLWGMHGTGKTTVIQQVCARLGRPVLRKQHTINMQETDVLGQWTVKNGQTEFQLGPLPMAMIMGWSYIADEYDFAMPSVTAVYQPVMEGEPLLISDAPLHLRKIVPHPEFRFFATGNTNGCGDETGLYQGTLMQNAANYSRFGVTEEVKYMDPATEIAVLKSKAAAPDKGAKQIVDFATRIRDAFANQKISMTISPRELINAAQLGLAFGGKWLDGMNLAFINRLPRIDQKVARDLAQRVFD